MSLQCMSATFDFLVFEYTDGSSAAFSVNGLKITPDESAMVLNVVNTEKSATIEVSALSRAYFSNEQSGIIAPGAPLPDGALKFNLKGVKATDSDAKGMVIIRHRDGTTTKMLQ